MSTRKHQPSDRIAPDSDDEAQRAELRRQLVERLRTGEGIDVDATYEVREHGWTHS